VVELRTARANGIPHSTLRFGRSPRKWSPIDRTLAIALTVYEDGLCPKCGHPRHRAWNDDMRDLYKAHRVTCVACLAVHEETSHRAPTGAEVVFVSDEAPDGFEPDPRMAQAL